MDEATKKAREELLLEATGFIELGGKRWKIKYGFQQITEFERLSGVSVLQVAAMMLAIKVDTVVKGLWVAMRQQQPKITEAKICRYLDDEPKKLSVSLKEFVAAIINAMPEAEEDDDAPLPEAPAGGEPVGTGMSS